MQRWSSHEGLGSRLSSHLSAEVPPAPSCRANGLGPVDLERCIMPSGRLSQQCHRQPKTACKAVSRDTVIMTVFHAPLTTCRASCGGCPARRRGRWAGGCPARKPAAASAWTAASWAGRATPGAHQIHLHPKPLAASLVPEWSPNVAACDHFVAYLCLCSHVQGAGWCTCDSNCSHAGATCKSRCLSCPAAACPTCRPPARRR
jgi:hypothetical protein